MSSTRLRLLLAALLLLPLLLYWGFGGTRLQPPRQAPMEPAADYFMRGVQVDEYGDDGRLKRQMSASELKHLPQLAEHRFSDPHLKIYREGRPPLQITALRGTLDDAQQELELEGKVRVHDNPDTGRGSQLDTSRMTLYPQRDFAQTDAPVVLTTAYDRVTATGMTADLAAGRMELLSDVKGLHNHAQ